MTLSQLNLKISHSIKKCLKKKSSTVEINCTSNFVGHLYFALYAWNNGGSFCEKFSFDCRSTHKATATTVRNKTVSKQNHRRNVLTAIGGPEDTILRRVTKIASFSEECAAHKSRFNEEMRASSWRYVVPAPSPAKKDRRRAAVGEKTNRKWRVSRGESLALPVFPRNQTTFQIRRHTGFAFLSAIKHSQLLSFYHFFSLCFSLSLSFF